MFLRRIFTFLLCCCMLQNGASGQEYSYVQYTVQNGLAGSTVYDVAQDKDGFVWFATETGLTRIAAILA